MAKIPITRTLALRDTRKASSVKAATALLHTFQKEQNVLDGLQRTYTAYSAEDRDRPADDSTMPARVVWSELQPVIKQLMEFSKLSLELATANQRVTATLDHAESGKRLVDIPLPFLLEFEKQLTNMITLIESTPSLDPRRSWSYDKDKALYQSVPETTVRNKSIPQVITKAPATAEHPAQTELVPTVTPVGEYKTTYLSGRIPAGAKREVIRRLTDLRTHVRSLRAEANASSVELRTDSTDGLLQWAFAPLNPHDGASS